MLNWLLWTDGGLLVRLGAGAAILATLALIDLARKGRSATRWREYAVLVAGASLAMLYGLLNDLVASCVSWEYFYYGKGLDAVLGPQVPPEMAALRWEACKIGIKSTWSVGLLAAVVLLLANNPRRGIGRLKNRTLIATLPAIFVATAVVAILGGVLGHLGLLTWTSHDLEWIVHDRVFRPERFLAVYGLNLGGYAGGLLSTVAAALWITKNRTTTSPSPVRTGKSMHPVHLP